MNVIRTLPLLVLALALTACAGKPARDSAPASVAVDSSAAAATTDTAVAATDSASTDVPAPVADVAAPTDAGTPPASGDAAPTNAEDDFAALYGGPAPSVDGTEPNRATYDPWEPLNRRVHSFNNVVDRAIARPLATASTHVVPRFAHRRQ
jgi:phospholipid-binding lipoprotein MlaA